MKIALLHNFYRSSSPSGENNAVLAQLNLLRKREHEVRLFEAHSDEMPSNMKNLARHALNVAMRSTSVPELIRNLNEFKPDILHVHNTFPMIGTTWLRDYQGPVVVTLHNFRTVCASGLLTRDSADCRLCPEESSFNSIIHKCYRDSAIKSIPLAIATRNAGSKSELLQRANAIVVLSEYSEYIFKQSVANCSIVRIPNFSNIDQPKSMHPKIENHWIYVGRLSAEKGILELIRNWPSSQRLLVYGSGELQGEVNEAIAGNDNIRYMGPVSREDLTNVLAKSKGLVFPSTCRENFPMIYVEAMTTGTPVVAFGANSVAGLVISDRTGTVFENWMDLPAALSKLELSRETLSLNALRLAESKYSQNACYRNIIAVYELAIRNYNEGPLN